MAYPERGDTAGSNGDFSIPITPIKAGTEVKVTAEDVRGNVSEAVKLIVADVTAPLAPKVDIVTNQSLKVKGKSESDAVVKVMVKHSSNPIGETLSEKDGSFNVEIPAYPTTGEQFYVTVTDGAGNVSNPT
jgi:hypothetical protein